MQEPPTEIKLHFGTKELLSIQKGLSLLFGSKTPLPNQIKKALKTSLKDARASIKTKKKSNQGTKISPLEPCLKKRYLTSKGNFLIVRNMDRNHLFNAVRKMERIYPFMKDKGGQAFKDADSAFPSLPGFAGYSDLISALKWHDQKSASL